MKEPKTFDHPRLYTVEIDGDTRLRIIYLNHYPEFSWLKKRSWSDNEPQWSNSPACWYREGMTPRQQVRAMNRYDKKFHRSKAKFICEL
jgi:hypothetical protein